MVKAFKGAEAGASVDPIGALGPILVPALVPISELLEEKESDRYLTSPITKRSETGFLSGSSRDPFKCVEGMGSISHHLKINLYNLLLFSIELYLRIQ